MLRTLGATTVLALALASCSAPPPAASPEPCPEPARRSGDAEFDEKNMQIWRNDLKANGPAACAVFTKAYIDRMEEQRGKMFLAKASGFAIWGRVTDAATGEPVAQACVTPGQPGSICWSRTDADGWYLLDLGAVMAREGFYEIYFSQTSYPLQHTVNRFISGRPRIDHQMTK